jgi:hypothetical protein
VESNLLFSFAVLLAGLGLLAAGIAVFFRQRAFLARSRTTSGTVVELLTSHRSGKYLLKRTPSGFTIEPKRLYRPVIRFTAPDGHTQDVTAPVASHPAELKVGETVTIRFDPADPAQARIDRPLYLWFGTGMLIFFGFFAIGMGLLGMVLNRLFPVN